VTKILAVIPSNTFGGAHNQVLQLSAGLGRLGFDVAVIVPDEPGNAAGRLSDAGIPVQSLPLRRPRAGDVRGWLAYVLGFGTQVRALRAAISAHGPDIVQAHGLLQLDVALAARLAARPLVWQLLDTRPPRWLASLLGPVMLALSTVVMTTGTTTAEAYPALRRTRRPVVPFYPPVPRSIPALDGATDGRPVAFGCLANINPQKGYDLVVRAFAAAELDGVAELRLRGAIAPGHEHLHEELSRLVRETGASNIDLRTEPTTPDSFLPTLDVLVLGSAARSEGTPTVIIEGMSIGLPVLATRVGGVPELVDDGATGYLVEPGDVAAMSERMRQLASDAGTRTAMGRRAKDKADESFTIEATLRSYEQAYAACLGERR
jgi:glycosyltransferase involved in cell wall biosynthesis